MVVPNYETTCKDQELIISRLEKENRFLREENQELKADYGTKAQVERDLLMEENQKYKEVIDKAIEYIENTTIVSDSYYHQRQCLLDILKEVE